ncbi:hepatocellular carcinoma-associated antigen 59 domain-containing protein [Trichoderma breve]|uniref:Hepatocellular carcinoma-associated antigen 59 domain-containing protein n=1 Tax=Trichoderma breve TaxID=2034170 RepID=A0A9W9E735_9HYPO|nr:hepatocellular carcinoma-associated antigen 59 domain-containing protein [Trichoderma breve]KAJ4860524.1 hepatocellular carcinoma-associated antigen 59 domain-containing protein [Trichoderma breve]
MEPDQDGNTPTTEPIRFRAGKKRKAYRQRPTEEEESHDVATVIPAPSILPGASKLEDGEPGRDANADAEKLLRELEGEDDNGDDGDDRMDGESAVAAALRIRNARRAARRGGVGFRSEGRNQDDEDLEGEHALVLRDADKDAAHDRIVGGITNRFMHQTGLLTILDDKHMNEYIESRLASRSADPHGTSPSSQPASQSATTNQGLAGDSNHQDKWRDQPTRHGKLVEVDMANLDSARNNNSNDSHKRRRVETDGAAKPPPRRGRNRRNSQDIARDALVEQFLHENRLDVYNVPSSSTATASSAPGADPSADDRLAEEFRQQYYDEQAMRRKKKRPVQQQKQQQQQSGDVLKGPKLGGSRNMRAAVRDKLLQQEKEKKGR